MRLKPFVVLLAVLSSRFAEAGQAAGRDASSPTRALTVPPCFARSAGELLLPKEVVDSDKD